MMNLEPILPSKAFVDIALKAAVGVAVGVISFISSDVMKEVRLIRDELAKKNTEIAELKIIEGQTSRRLDRFEQKLDVLIERSR